MILDAEKAIEKIDEFIGKLEPEDTSKELSVGIVSRGKNATITGNTIEDFDVGIYSEGDDATIDGNAIRNASTVMTELKLLKIELKSDTPDAAKMSKSMKVFSIFAPYISASLLAFNIIRTFAGGS
jgi:putative cofactor-binding repeat protein